MRVAIYIRVSTDEQALHGFSLASQREECIKKAREIGAISILEFADEGETGKTLNRPGLEHLRQAVSERLIDIVVILDPDRFSRKLSQQLLVTEEFEKANVKLIFVNFEWENTPEGRLFYALRGAVSEYEREKIIERMVRGKNQKAKQGRPPMGVYHYGYDYDPVTEQVSINEKEAHTVRYIYNSLAKENKSPAAIAISLTESGVPTKKGKGYWHRQVVRQILLNPTYKGEWHYNKNLDEPIIIPMPVIVEPEIWEQAQKLMKESRRAWNSKAKRQYLLSGLLTCGDCGRTMGGIYAKYWGRHYRGYTCRKSKSASRFQGCQPQKIINAESLEHIVWERFKNLFIKREELMDEVKKNLPKQDAIEQELVIIEQQIQDANKGRESLIEALSLGILDLDDKTKEKLLNIKNRKETLTEKQKELQRNLLAFQFSSHNFTELYNAISAVINDIDELAFEQKRNLIRSVISQIEVTGRCNPTNTKPGELPGVHVAISIRIEEMVRFDGNTEESHNS